MNKLLIWFVVGSIFALVSAFAGCKSSGDDNGDLVKLLVLQQVQQGLSNPAFVYSCDSRSTNSACTNNYKAGTSCSSSTFSTSKCPATNAYGECRSTFSGGVYYPGNSVCSSSDSCGTRCTTQVGGTWISPYTAQ